MIYLNQKPND